MLQSQTAGFQSYISFISTLKLLAGNKLLSEVTRNKPLSFSVRETRDVVERQLGYSKGAEGSVLKRSTGLFSHNHGSSGKWLRKTSWRHLFSTSMVIGGKVETLYMKLLELCPTFAVIFI